MSKLRVIVLGDEQVGKTSIIRTFVSQSFPTEVPPANPPIIIPAELSDSKSFLTIIDFYYRREQENSHQLIQEIKKADGIVLVYDVSRPQTFQHAVSFWLPLIYENSKSPSILVGNKNDMTSLIENKEAISEEIRARFPECYIQIETSAKSYVSISKLFQITQQAILYPASPLFNTAQNCLSENFIRILKLIYRKSDKDRDFRLNLLEIQGLNKAVYGQNLSLKDAGDLFSMISNKCSDGIDDKGIKFEGFVKLQELLIKKLKTKNSWALLKHFGFNENLDLEQKIDLKIEEGKSCEFSNDSIQFLVDIFKQYSVDSLLTREGIFEIFSTITTPPWETGNFKSWDDYIHFVSATPDRELSISSWLSLWTFLIYTKPAETVKTLLMIGYPNKFQTAYTVTSARNFSKESDRKVFKVNLLGDDIESQNSLMRSFLGKNIRDHVPSVVCGAVDPGDVFSDNTYLLLCRDPDLNTLEECDISCIIFDGSLGSINFLKERVLTLLPQKMPRLLILNKRENQDHENVYAFSLELGLREYAQVNFSKKVPDSLFKQIKDTAQYPYKGSLRRDGGNSGSGESSSIAFWFLLGMGFATSAVFIGKRLIQNNILKF
ncbi:unnamed protein product [Blepharisma stoltei]|uniref:Miro domain-containing protein n=1 Tax=Blepharisma stoltei TaxID=1481888 RepID=A0AAU9JFV8_9CILI|nr:unnamed protein product [Blepharisma stoltei]